MTSATRTRRGRKMSETPQVETLAMYKRHGDPKKESQQKENHVKSPKEESTIISYKKPSKGKDKGTIQIDFSKKDSQHLKSTLDPNDKHDKKFVLTTFTGDLSTLGFFPTHWSDQTSSKLETGRENFRWRKTFSEETAKEFFGGNTLDKILTVELETKILEGVSFQKMKIVSVGQKTLV